MSKPRYNWWSFALAIIRDYPMRCSQLKNLRQAGTAQEKNGTPTGAGPSRATENIALRQLPPQEQREYEAVHKALRRTAAMKAGKVRQEIIKLTMWKGYTIAGAALMVHETDYTVRRYRWQFVMLVGHMYGFLTEEEYIAAVKRDAVGGKIGIPEPK